MRITQIVCDRCRQEITGDPFILVPLDSRTADRIDFCPICEVAFKEWLSARPAAPPLEPAGAERS